MKTTILNPAKSQKPKPTATAKSQKPEARSQKPKAKSQKPKPKAKSQKQIKDFSSKMQQKGMQIKDFGGKLPQTEKQKKHTKKKTKKICPPFKTAIRAGCARASKAPRHGIFARSCHSFFKGIVVVINIVAVGPFIVRPAPLAAGTCEEYKFKKCNTRYHLSIIMQIKLAKPKFPRVQKPRPASAAVYLTTASCLDVQPNDQFPTTEQQEAVKSVILQCFYGVNTMFHIIGPRSICGI